MSCGQPNFVMWPEVCYEGVEIPMLDSGLPIAESDAGADVDATMLMSGVDGGETTQDDGGLRPAAAADATPSLDSTHASTTSKASGCSQGTRDNNRCPWSSICLLVLLLVCKPIHTRR